MEFDLTEQQELLRKTVADFIKEECPREYARQLDEEEKFPHELYNGPKILDTKAASFKL